MLEQLPSYINFGFFLTTIAALAGFYLVLKKTRLSNRGIYLTVGAILIWLALQAYLSLAGFYTTNPNILPPRFLLAILPPLLFILYLFLNPGSKPILDSFDLIPVTYLHVVRIPVEIVLYWLAIEKTIPDLMTFAGRNFDILAGITAPFVAYFGFQQGRLGQRTKLIWNFIALGLLLFIVGNALLSAPFPFQQFAFDQPNIAVLHFPFVWLPTFIVPIVLLGHLVSIRNLLQVSEKA